MYREPEQRLRHRPLACTTLDPKILISSHGRILLRAFHADSFCKYDPSLGILSSNYAACKPAKDLRELIDRGEISEAILVNHCGGSTPTSFISLTDDPCFLLKHIERCWPHRGPRAFSTGMVAFINMTKLDYMSVFAETSLNLVDGVGAKRSTWSEPGGVSYATCSHFMVYGWIPIQCIEKLISLADFQRACSRVPGPLASNPNHLYFFSQRCPC